VEALDMRTLGLGGDSRIVRLDGVLQIGPQRIAPVAWLASGHPRTGEALEWLAHHLNQFETSTRGMELLALTPYPHRRARNDREARLIERLRERPCSIAELVECEQCGWEESLPLASLEENHVVQRCGLTPTDLLHADERLHLWDGGASRRLCDLYATLMRTSRAQLLEQGFNLFVRRLALELLKKQLADEMDPDQIEESPAAMALIERALGERADGYSVRIALKAPVIGIGAPAHFFLPAAARLLQAEAIVPVHADVANAIGAITSLVRIHRRVAIVANDAGLYRIEGLPGTPTFSAVEDAQNVAVAQLREVVLDLGRQAGTGQPRVEIRVHDRVAPLKDGQLLFIERSVEACLTGRPDLSRFGEGSAQDGEH
jgi:N-methylhydantoinase A/oxoprolinase/acetone carboxylase beta subunit